MEGTLGLNKGGRSLSGLSRQPGLVSFRCDRAQSVYGDQAVVFTGKMGFLHDQDGSLAVDKHRWCHGLSCSSSCAENLTKSSLAQGFLSLAKTHFVLFVD